MKVFFDCEFTGLRKETTLISIGFIAENGRQFYGEFTDYDKKQCNSWIKTNVLKHTLQYDYKAFKEQLEMNGDVSVVIGTKKDIRKALSDWFKQFKKVQLVSDVCHYDMVLFIDIFGTAFDIPENVSPTCEDINPLIAQYYGISQVEAFNKSREEIVSRMYGVAITGVKHNSLYDAKVIKVIYNKIHNPDYVNEFFIKKLE